MCIQCIRNWAGYTCVSSVSDCYRTFTYRGVSSVSEAGADTQRLWCTAWDPNCISHIVSSPGCKARISTGPACPASGGQFPALASRRPAAGIMNGWHTWAGAPGMIRCAKCGAAVHGRTRHECGLGNEVAEPVPVSVSPRSWHVRSPGPDQGSPLAREVMFRQHRQSVSVGPMRGQVRPWGSAHCGALALSAVLSRHL